VQCNTTTGESVKERNNAKLRQLQSKSFFFDANDHGATPFDLQRLQRDCPAPQVGSIIFTCFYMLFTCIYMLFTCIYMLFTCFYMLFTCIYMMCTCFYMLLMFSVLLMRLCGCTARRHKWVQPRSRSITHVAAVNSNLIAFAAKHLLTRSFLPSFLPY
jgi:hypothetical protein